MATELLEVLDTERFSIAKKTSWDDLEEEQEEGEAPDPSLVANNGINIYYREIQGPLLTAKQEVSLSKIINIGKRASNLLARNPSPIRSAQLQNWVHRGNVAFRQFFNSNLRLVFSLARRYENRSVPLMDLIQEGNVGLMKAINKFDPRRGFKFSTYATWWIWQSVTREIQNNGRTIRLPIHIQEKITEMIHVEGRLTQELSREPKIEEVAKELGWTIDVAKDIKQARSMTLSLNYLIGKDQDSELESQIPDPKARFDNKPGETDQFEKLHQALDNLTPRERVVIEMRNGFDPYEGAHSLSEIGEILGLSRERIRQIEAEAMRKLKKSYLF